MKSKTSFPHSISEISLLNRFRSPKKNVRSKVSDSKKIEKSFSHKHKKNPKPIGYISHTCERIIQGTTSSGAFVYRTQLGVISISTSDISAIHKKNFENAF